MRRPGVRIPLVHHIPKALHRTWKVRDPRFGDRTSVPADQVIAAVRLPYERLVDDYQSALYRSSARLKQDQSSLADGPLSAHKRGTWLLKTPFRGRPSEIIRSSPIDIL